MSVLLFGLLVLCLRGACAQPQQHQRTLLRKHDPSEERVVVRVGDHAVDVDRLAAEHGFANLGEMLTVPSNRTNTLTHSLTHTHSLTLTHSQRTLCVANA
jgi:hypothetical protein